MEFSHSPTFPDGSMTCQLLTGGWWLICSQNTSIPLGYRAWYVSLHGEAHCLCGRGNAYKVQRPVGALGLLRVHACGNRGDASCMNESGPMRARMGSFREKETAPVGSCMKLVVAEEPATVLFQIRRGPLGRTRESD